MHSNGVEVQLFKVFNPGVYTYIGQVELASEPYQEQQPDKNNEMRDVWIFPLRLIVDKPVTLPREVIKAKQKFKEKTAKN